MFTAFNVWRNKRKIERLQADRDRDAAHHMEWVKKNLPHVTAEISSNIIYQFWASGVKLDHVNRWLRFRKMKPIKWYSVIDSKTMRYGHDEPTKEQRDDARAEKRDIVFIA